jgi:RNA polymerase primary sigma factor
MYLAEATKYRLLNKAQEREFLAKARTGDIKARDKFIHANLRLVVWIAKRYRTMIYGKPSFGFMDLIQEGNKGLLRAAKDFNLDFDTKFSTYAVWWIKQTIKRAIHDFADVVRIPVNTHEAFSRLKKAETALFKTGLPVTVERLADELGLSEEQVRYLQELNSHRLIHIDAPIRNDDEGGSRLGDLIPDFTVRPPEVVIDEKNLQRKLRVRLKMILSIKEYQIVELRFGLDGQREHTLDEVGKKFSVTRERIRQLQVRITDKIVQDLSIIELFSQINPQKASLIRKEAVRLKREAIERAKEEMANVVEPVIIAKKVVVKKEKRPKVEFPKSGIFELIQKIAPQFGVIPEDVYNSPTKADCMKIRHRIMYLLLYDLRFSYDKIVKEWNGIDLKEVKDGYEKIKKQVKISNEIVVEDLRKMRIILRGNTPQTL